MNHDDAWLLAIPLAWLIVAAFWPAKAKWRPFGGLFKHDKRKGTLQIVVPLPGKKRGRR